MPVHDGSRSNQDERLPPPRPERSQRNPEQLVQGSQSSARPLRVQSEQLPTKSQVFEGEVLARAKRADDPPEEMPERHNHGKNTIATTRISFAPSHSFCRCTTFWRGTGDRTFYFSGGNASQLFKAVSRYEIQINKSGGGRLYEKDCSWSDRNSDVVRCWLHLGKRPNLHRRDLRQPMCEGGVARQDDGEGRNGRQRK